MYFQSTQPPTSGTGVKEGDQWFDTAHNNAQYVLIKQTDGSLKWILASDANDKIENGKIVINGNTVFNGDATIVSQGEDETTIIQGGSITFTRGGKPITVIRNIKIGTVETDGDGREIDLSDLKSCDVITSIHSFDITSNIRSLNSGATQIDPVTNKWKIFLYGSEAVLTGGKEGSFVFSGTVGTFDLEYIKIIGNSMSVRVGNPNIVWSKREGYYRSHSINTTLEISMEVREENSLGSSLIGYYNGVLTNVITPKIDHNSNTVYISLPYKDVFVPITIDRTSQKLLNSTITIKILSLKGSMSGTVIFNVGPDQDVARSVDWSGDIYQNGNNTFKYTYYQEQNSPIQGKGVVQYMAIEK